MCSTTAPLQPLPRCTTTLKKSWSSFFLVHSHHFFSSSSSNRVVGWYRHFLLHFAAECRCSSFPMLSKNLTASSASRWNQVGSFPTLKIVLEFDPRHKMLKYFCFFSSFVAVKLFQLLAVIYFWDTLYSLSLAFVIFRCSYGNWYSLQLIFIYKGFHIRTDESSEKVGELELDTKPSDL